MQSLIALCCRLIRIVYTLITKEQKFDADKLLEAIFTGIIRCRKQLRRANGSRPVRCHLRAIPLTGLQRVIEAVERWAMETGMYILTRRYKQNCITRLLTGHLLGSMLMGHELKSAENRDV